MSYLRGENYIWSDGERVHIWVADGRDHWDDAGWSVGDDGKRHPGRVNASGVGIDESVLDEFVVMRFAEIITEGKLEQTIGRVLAPGGQGGNFGSGSLKRLADELVGRLSDLQPRARSDRRQRSAQQRRECLCHSPRSS